MDTLMDWVIISTLPFITALIGWLTNKVAIKMLFRPQRSISICGWKWQGLIPRRQKDIARQTGEIIERDILSHHDLRREIMNIDLNPHLHEFTSRLIRNKLGSRLKTIPLIGNFINEKMLARLENVALDEMMHESTALMDHLAHEMEHHIEIKTLVEQRIAEFDLDKLESVVNKAANSEFRTIEILGGILGFIIGLGQVLLLWLTGYIQI